MAAAAAAVDVAAAAVVAYIRAQLARSWELFFQLAINYPPLSAASLGSAPPASLECNYRIPPRLRRPERS